LDARTRYDKNACKFTSAHDTREVAIVVIKLFVSIVVEAVWPPSLANRWQSSYHAFPGSESYPLGPSR